MSDVSREGIPQLDLRLLGPLEVSGQGQRLTVGGPKPRALLAALALAPGSVVSVDQLIENLWPGEPPDTAAHALQVYVSQLRKTLGTETIATRAPGYVLDVDPVRVDVHRFVRLARALPRATRRLRRRLFVRRSRSGAGLHSPTSRTSPLHRPRSRVSGSFVSSRWRSGSMPISRSAARSSSSPSSRPSSTCSRCASDRARS